MVRVFYFKWLKTVRVGLEREISFALVRDEAQGGAERNRARAGMRQQDVADCKASPTPAIK